MNIYKQRRASTVCVIRTEPGVLYTQRFHVGLRDTRHRPPHLQPALLRLSCFGRIESLMLSATHLSPDFTARYEKFLSRANGTELGKLRITIVP